MAHINETDDSTDNKYSKTFPNDTICNAQFEYKLGYSDLPSVAIARVPRRWTIYAKLESGGSNVNKERAPTNRTLSTPDKASISLRTSKGFSSTRKGFKVNVRFIFLLIRSEFTRKLVRRIHLETLDGGVQLTMDTVRETYWVPTLRQLVKAIRLKCWGCRPLTATPVVKPVAG